MVMDAETAAVKLDDALPCKSKVKWLRRSEFMIIVQRFSQRRAQPATQIAFPFGKVATRNVWKHLKKELRKHFNTIFAAWPLK